MFKNFLSRYSPRYLYSLLYILQASEYSSRNYFNWYFRTTNFTKVEYRKTLQFTPKSKILFISLCLSFFFWIILLTFSFLNFYFYLNFSFTFSLIYLVFGLILTPYFLAYILPLINFLGFYLLQLPIETYLLHQTQKKLANHSAIKIAVLGSYGKTTMKELLHNVLNAYKKTAATPGNFNTPLGIRKFVNNLQGDEAFLVFEFGEYYPKDISKLAHLVKPNYAILTGINEAHLEKFKNLDQTVKTFLEILEIVPAENLLVNQDSPLAKTHAPASSIFYSHNGIGNLTVDSPQTNLNGTSFILKNDNESYTLSSKLLGLHQIGPLFAVFYLCRKLGVSTELISKTLTATESFKHRLQPKTLPSGLTLIDDSYNGNPDGAKAAMNFLKTLRHKTRVYVTPGLVELGSKNASIHEQLGKHLANCADKVILIKNSTTPHLEAGLKSAGFTGSILHLNSMPDFFQQMDNLTTPNDVVLIQNDWPDNYA